jgi:uncharacterized protein YecE (DUF72 family)
MHEKVKSIFIIFNNHPAGNAVANAFEMLQFLNQNLKNSIPQSIQNSYPRIEISKQSN